jgi:hypothetical protein
VIPEGLATKKAFPNYQKVIVIFWYFSMKFCPEVSDTNLSENVLSEMENRKMDTWRPSSSASCPASAWLKKGDRGHRNLKTRTSTYVLQILFGGKTPCKKLADLHPRQGNLIQRTVFSGLQNTLFTSQNRVEIS